MKRILLISLVLVAICHSNSFSARIQLKHKFWHAWEYSLDNGASWRSISGSARGLLKETSTDSLAHNEIRKFRNQAMIADALVIPGGLATVASIIWGVTTEFGDEAKAGLIVGIPITVIGYILGVESNKHLQRGVALYNETQPLSALKEERLQFCYELQPCFISIDLVRF